MSSKTKYFILLALLLFSFEKGFSCSMYKITFGGKTIVGCNEDAWRLTPHVWFENAVKSGHYGAAFTGSRFDGVYGYAPQSGMNEFGLAFSRLASYTPKKETLVADNRKAITTPTLYLKDILHTCKTVEDVKDYISKYDQSYFIEDVFIYIDKSGKYLVVEPYTMTFGDDPTYVLSNFCPSGTKASDALRLDRYRKGVEFLKTKIDTTLDFCTALSDTMHVCRGKIGDGTLLTSIWDLGHGTFSLYFYHEYKDVVNFNLGEELAKGDHLIEIKTLFPTNPEFKKLEHYKISKNSTAVMLFLICSGGLFLFSSIFFMVDYYRTRKSKRYAYIELAFFPLGIILFYYMYVLCTTINIFYFPSPYKDHLNILISIASYIPFLLLLLIFPFLQINWKVLKENTWSLFPKLLFTINSFVYIILLGLFAYWGLFNVFS